MCGVTYGLSDRLIEDDQEANGDRSGEGDNGPVMKCCGKYPNRIPFQYKSTDGEERRCCEGNLV